MNFQSTLDELGITYRVLNHPTAYTAQDLAEKEHVPGRQVVKGVVVEADGHYFMCALPACYRIDFDELKAQLNAKEVRLAEEAVLGKIFKDCELGAEPPIGRLYGIPTLMDESLCADNHVTFQAGSHREAVTMSLAEYRRLAMPEMAHFGRPMN
jgi:Ala-tRNA(Pro) deacylase